MNNKINNRTNLIGMKFNRLKVLEEVEYPNHPERKWKCQCDCGKIITVFGSNIRRNHTKSCGCLRKEESSYRNSTHRKTESEEYKIWSGMKYRCNSPACRSYPNYGGRGIKVCEEWSASFELFHRDMGDRPGPEYSLDRIDPNGNYSKDNCRWATSKEQSLNKTCNVRYLFNGENLTLVEWGKRLGIRYHTLRKRISYGWSIEKTLTEPLRESHYDK